MKPKIEVVEGAAPTASARILADANHIEYELDKRGRRVGVKKLTFHDHYKMSKLLGQFSANGTAMNDALMAASVVEIDGEPIPRAGTELQLEAIMIRLDWDGVAAATAALMRLAPPDSEADQDATIKN
jgi:hypothetical protein